MISNDAQNSRGNQASTSGPRQEADGQDWAEEVGSVGGEGEEEEEVEEEVEIEAEVDVDVDEAEEGNESEAERGSYISELVDKFLTSHPSLTPTPPTPCDELVEVEQSFGRQTATTSGAGRSTGNSSHPLDRHKARGPALEAAKSFDESDDPDKTTDLNEDLLAEAQTVEVNKILDSEREYFSDPDFHDERPAKKSVRGDWKGFEVNESYDNELSQSDRAESNDLQSIVDENFERDTSSSGEVLVDIECTIQLNQTDFGDDEDERQDQAVTVFDIKTQELGTESSGSESKSESESESQSDKIEAKDDCKEELKCEISSEEANSQTESSRDSERASNSQEEEQQVEGSECETEPDSIEEDSSSEQVVVESNDHCLVEPFSAQQYIEGGPPCEPETSKLQETEEAASSSEEVCQPCQVKSVENSELSVADEKDHLIPSESLDQSQELGGDNIAEISARKSVEALQDSNESESDCSEKLSGITEIHLASGDEENSSEFQVTASEARPELFVDESTIADDLTSLDVSQMIVINSDIEGSSTESELQCYPSQNKLASKIAGSAAPNMNAHRQESLDDIESSVFDASPEITDEKWDSSGEIRASTEVIRSYCTKLLQMVEEEALEQVDRLSSNRIPLTVNETAESSTSDREHEQGLVAASKKVYSTSMYYNDNKDSFPTIDQQVERCRSIVRQLEDGFREDPSDRTSLSDARWALKEDAVASTDVISDDPAMHEQSGERSKSSQRASTMFKRRRERMSKYTFGNSIEEMESETGGGVGGSRQAAHRVRRASLEPVSLSNGLRSKRSSTSDKRIVLSQIGAGPSLESEGERDVLTDTEYEAPKVRRRSVPTRATTTPFSERKSRHIEVEEGAASAATIGGPIKGGQNSEQTVKAKYKPFLDSSTLKDIEKLRLWSPYGECNEHNSVSPEICLKLVQDLHSATRCETKPVCQDEGGPVSASFQVEQGSLSVSKGAKLFERRKLESSDWIIAGLRASTSNEEETGAQVSNSWSLGVAGSEQTQNASRPSLSEETVMVADESGAPIIELVPVMSHAQPKLELATITRTPSFCASARRVIECSSPELATDSTEPASDMSDLQFGASEKDGPAEAGRLALVEGRQGEERPSELASGGQLTRSKRDEDTTGSSSPTSGAILYDSGNSNEPTICDVDSIKSCASATVARVRPQSRSSELHQASLLDWGSRVSTPTWMSTLQCERLDEERTLVRYKQRLPTTMETFYTSPRHQTAQTEGRRRCASLSHESEFEPRPRSSVSALRQSYQNLVEQTNSKSASYRSYHYPFAERDWRRSCSLSRWDIAEEVEEEEAAVGGERRVGEDPARRPTRLAAPLAAGRAYRRREEEAGARLHSGHAQDWLRQEEEEAAAAANEGQRAPGKWTSERRLLRQWAARSLWGRRRGLAGAMQLPAETATTGVYLFGARRNSPLRAGSRWQRDKGKHFSAFIILHYIPF